MNYAPAILTVALACLAVNTTAKTQYIPSHMPPPVWSQPSQPSQPLHLPPVEYDYPYKGKLTIERVTPEQLRARCTAATVISLGCAFPSAYSCLILLVDDASIRARGWTRELMLRHEIAHCNGWPDDHPGMRPLH
jgi:hypothetical protein